MEEQTNVYRELFTTFFKIGAFTFGGGYAMIPLIRTEVVEKKQWMKEEDIVDMLAVAESTPGPLAINSATFVGYHKAGTKGAACATIGVMLPSFFIILLLSSVLRQFEQLKVVSYAFWGIRIGVLGLILHAAGTMAKGCRKDLFSYIVVLVAFLAVTWLDISSIWVLCLCGTVGIFVTTASEKRMDGER